MMILLFCLFFMSLSAMECEEEMRIMPVSTESTPLLHAERQTCNLFTYAKNAFSKLDSGWRNGSIGNHTYNFTKKDHSSVYLTGCATISCCIGCGAQMIPNGAVGCVLGYPACGFGCCLIFAVLVKSVSDGNEVRNRILLNQPSPITMRK